ncbi:phage tail protein [Salmonella enterica subsp. enterica serovar Telelkebir]|nr:phage tail protein [Salmonella enterica subsp. enterica serovar Telelkebir]ECC3295653.1 phage tail protein [Salmonella enterica subsp. enterica]ECF0258986.1 phage tail protein [Salmonella enterica subsp. enterica serovar Agbeni]EEI6239518.1 phage tail protein [Salmonella enterica subsp. enterica serovar Tudu]EDR2888308.1 phage tail protein [Salmonella enterica subsp. enterica]
MILGIASIRINGREIQTEGKSTLNPGGYARTQHMGGGKVWGVSRKMAAPSIKMVIAADEDVDVIEISNWEEVTVMFEGDNGLSYMMTGSATDNPAELDEDSGQITANFIGTKITKV